MLFFLSDPAFTPPPILLARPVNKKLFLRLPVVGNGGLGLSSVSGTALKQHILVLLLKYLSLCLSFHFRSLALLSCSLIKNICRQEENSNLYSGCTLVCLFRHIKLY